MSVLSGKIGNLSHDGDWSESHATFGLLVVVLNDRIGGTDKQRVFEGVLGVLPLETAVRAMNALVESQAAGIYQLQKAIDIASAKRTVSERFRSEFAKPSADIFQTNPRPVHVLYQIGIYDQACAEMVNAYALGLCEVSTLRGKLTEG